MRRAATGISGARIAGIAIAAAVIAVALVFGRAARFQGELVRALPGPAGVTAEHLTGTAGGEAVQIVRLTGGTRPSEALRLQGPAAAMRWTASGNLMVCTDTAAVLRHRPEVSVAGTAIDILVAPVPAGECAP